MKKKEKKNLRWKKEKEEKKNSQKPICAIGGELRKEDETVQWKKENGQNRKTWKRNRNGAHLPFVVLLFRRY